MRPPFLLTVRMEFDLRFLDEMSRSLVQTAIDGVNKAALDHPGAWKFVSDGGLIQANRDMGTKNVSQTNPIAVIIFNEMEKDGHSGYTAGWTISAVSQLAKDYDVWRQTYISTCLTRMKDSLNNFIYQRFMGKFPQEGDADWFDKRQRILHDLEYSFLAQNVLDEEDRTVLQFLLKMKSVSHLGNEVLFDQIEEQLQLA
jgi:hypothetical protein